MGNIFSCLNPNISYTLFLNSSTGLRPMLMPEILDQIFKHCSPSTWKTIRLVCKTWYYTLLPRWRAQKYFNIRHYFDTRMCPHKREQPIRFIGYMSIKNYFAIYSPKWKNIYKLQQMPCQIRISCDTMHVERPELIRLFTICGPSLKRLIVELPQSHMTKTLRKILFQFTPNLEHFEYYGDTFRLEDYKSEESTDDTKSEFIQPNLKSMIISRTYFDHLPFPIDRMELLSSFPNLQKLHLLGTLNNGTEPVDMDAFINIMDAIRTDKTTALNLTEFCFNIHPDFRHSHGLLDVYNKVISECALTKLGRLKLPLKKLTGNVQGMTNQDLINLISPYHQTLRELSLFNIGKNNTFTSCNEMFPDNLTTLNLHGSIFTNWNFLGFTPNLKTLVVNQWCTLVRNCVLHIVHVDLYRDFLGENGTPRLETVRPLVHLKTFVYLALEPVPVEGIRWLAIRMPNLNKAMITTDVTGPSVLFWQWPHLKHVEMQVKATMQSIVTMKNLVISSQETEPNNAIEQFTPDLVHMSTMFPRDFGIKPNYYLPEEINELIFPSQYTR